MHIRRTFQSQQLPRRSEKPMDSVFCDKLSGLNRLIKLPEHNACSSLNLFVQRYIDSVAPIVNALKELSKNAGLEKELEKFLTIAEQYFVDPPAFVKSRDGYHALIDESYLVHRLIEEVNDRLCTHYGAALAPLDFAVPNLIIHEVIGDELAHRLDHAVLYVVEILFSENSFAKSATLKAFLSQENKERREQMFNQWPSLKSEISQFNLKFDSSQLALH